MKHLLIGFAAALAISANAEIFDQTGALRSIGNETISNSLEKIEANEEKKALEHQLKTYEGFLEIAYKGCLKSETTQSANDLINYCHDLQKIMAKPTVIAPGKLIYVLLVAMTAQDQSDQAKREAQEIITNALLTQ